MGFLPLFSASVANVEIAERIFFRARIRAEESNASPVKRMDPDVRFT